MRRILRILVTLFLLSITGCGNLNPRINEKIDNQQGKIDEIRNNQNGLMLELGKLKNDAQISDSQLKEFQQGMLNLNAAISRNENSGVQILQGDGALIMVFGLCVIGMLLYWYRDRAVKSETAVDIITKEVARLNDPILNDNILKAAMHTDSEMRLYHLLSRHSQAFWNK
jgi:hypothetical protein